MARDPNEFAYGLEPSEITPVAVCKWCGQPIYTEKEIRDYDGDTICKDCEDFAYSGEASRGYILHLFGNKPEQMEWGSLKSFFMDMYGVEWLEKFGESVRFYFGEDYDRWIKF